VGERGSAKRVVHPGQILDALKHPIVGAALALTFTATFAFSTMELAFGLVAEHVWFPDLTRQEVAMQVGRILGMIGVIGIVIQGGLIGRLTRRFGEARVVVVGYTSNAFGLLALAFGEGDWKTWGACLFIAVGTSLANPSLQSLISKGVDEDRQGSVLGVNQSLGAFARATAPWVALLVYGVGRTLPFVLSGAVMLVALAAAGPATRRAMGETKQVS
jgi:DHA1 family tetracycline resistance protein-like MFS transporter